MSSNGKGNTPPPPQQISLNPEDILHQVTVVITKDGQWAIIGELDNLPLLLHLLSTGVDIVGGLVSQRLPQRIIPVTGASASGDNPFWEGGGIGQASKITIESGIESGPRNF